MAIATLTLNQVLAWRIGRQLLHRPAGVDPVDVVGAAASRVVGTWEARDTQPVVELWPESPPVPADRLDAERARARSYLSGGGDA